MRKFVILCNLRLYAMHDVKRRCYCVSYTITHAQCISYSEQ